MSPDEYQALLVDWVHQLDNLINEVDEARMCEGVTEEAYDDFGDIKQRMHHLLADMNAIAWPSGPSVRDDLFNQINAVALGDIRRMRLEVAKAEQRVKTTEEGVAKAVEFEVKNRTMRIEQDYAAKSARLDAEHKVQINTMEHVKHVLESEHRAKLRTIDDEVERRVRIRLYGHDPQDPAERDKRPILIGD